MGNGTKVGLVVVLVLGVVVIATLLDRDVEQAPDGREQARLDMDHAARTQYSPDLDPQGQVPDDDPAAGDPDPEDPQETWVAGDLQRNQLTDPGLQNREQYEDDGGSYLPEYRPRDLSQDPEFRYDPNGLTITRPEMEKVRHVSNDPGEVGLTHGVLRPEDDEPQTTPPPSDPPASDPPKRETTDSGDYPKTHEVVEGDRLWNIADTYYGKGHLYKHIVSANSSLTSADDIRPGMKLTIPAPPAGTSKAKSSSGSTASSSGRTHTIESGDTFSDLALRYLGSSSRYQEIVDLNPDVEPTRMSIGTVIKLPEK